MIGYAADKAVQRMDSYDQAEVYTSETVVNTIYIDNSMISNIETKTESGMMFRMVKDRRMGKSSVSLNGPDAVDECLRMAESVLKYSPENGDFKGYAQPAQARIAAPDVWDRKVEDITPEGLREIAREIIDNCRVNIPRAQLRISTTRNHVMNSNGVDCEHASTLVYGHFTSMTVKDHPGEGMETYHGTHLDLDPVAIAKALSDKAEAAAVSKEFKGSEKLSMILPPSELGDMMMSAVGSAVNGENRKYGRSMWKDSEGQPVASECLSLVDDPTIAAPLSCVFDDEGVPAYRKPIIEKGILKGFLRDTFCGDSTGNGMRRSSVEAQGAYDRTPTIKPLNLVVGSGRSTPDEIVEQTDNGILVEKFAWPEADEMTGRFGLSIRCGYLIRRGEVTGVINNALLMGNMLDAVANIEAIGNDPKQMGVITVPTMGFSGMELVGN